MKRTKFENGDLVLILIPEPNVTNYQYHHFNYQLGIVTGDLRYHSDTIIAIDVMLDFQKGLFDEFRLIKGMYIDHLLMISKAEFK